MFAIAMLLMRLIKLFCLVKTLLSPIPRPSRFPSSSPDLQRKDAYGLPSLRCESDSSSDSSASVPTTPSEAHATLQSLLYRGVGRREDLPSTIVYIDLLRPNTSIHANGPSWSSPSQVAEERALVERGYKIVRAAQYPRHFPDIDPTITLLSPSITNARSYFTVYAQDRLIFSESTSMEPVDPATSNVNGILYKTSLVPGFWNTISQSTGNECRTLRRLLSS